MNFTNYLQQHNYAASTINTYEKHTAYFLKWCTTKPIKENAIDYKVALQYVKHLNGKSISKKTIHLQLNAVKCYLNYQITKGIILTNPLENIQVKGMVRYLHSNLLEIEELELLYHGFDTEDVQETYHNYTAKRDKMIVGLIIYQGLDTRDLRLLTTQHLKLNQGKIYIPGTRKSDGRILELKPWQIIELMEYVKEVRPKLMKRTRSNNYFIPYDGIRFTITHNIIKKLKVYNPKIENSRQLRISVITYWLKVYNLRKVQYMAGHRYISSTEKYVQDDLVNLHEIVKNFHPIH